MEKNPSNEDNEIVGVESKYAIAEEIIKRLMERHKGPKPKPPPTDYIKRNIKRLKALQDQAEKKHGLNVQSKSLKPDKSSPGQSKFVTSSKLNTCDDASTTTDDSKKQNSASLPCENPKSGWSNKMEKSSSDEDKEKLAGKRSIWDMSREETMKMILERHRGYNPKPKPKPKNYVKKNIKLLRAFLEKMKQEQSLNLPRNLRKSKKYDHVQCKVFSLRKKVEPSKNTENVEPKTIALNTCDDACISTHKSKKENSSPLPDQNPRPKMPHPLGHIPLYIRRQKKKIVEDEKKRLEPFQEGYVPPGHSLIPEENRIDTLEAFKKNKADLLREYYSLPVRNDTLRLRRYRAELEYQLDRLEEGIVAFSFQRVLIRNH